MSRALVARLDSAGDVLITGPAVRAVAAGHDRLVFLAGPRGRAAAELLPGVDEVIEWQAPWVDFDSPELTSDHVTALIKQLRDVRPDRVFIFTSFHRCRWRSSAGWPGHSGSVRSVRTIRAPC